MALLAIPFILILLGSMVIGFVLLISRGKVPPVAGPRCGGCGYNLTGSESNRCPECGRLFIEVGVEVVSRKAKRGRRTLGVVLILLPLLLAVAGMVSSLMLARAARAQAVVAQQRALMAQQRTQQAADAAKEAEAKASKETSGSKPDAAASSE